jgi:hypothetical protein
LNPESLILLFLSFIHLDPTIRSQELFVYVTSGEYRLQMIYPVVEIYIVVYGYVFQTHRFGRHIERETEVARYIFTMSPYAMPPESQCDKKSHKPYHTRLCDNEKIDIRVLMCGEHRQRVPDCDHLNSRYPIELSYILLRARKKVQFV